jgi:exopolysaccharide production protein ExoQ
MLALYQRFDLRILFTIIACLLVPITLLARHGATGILIGMFTIAVCFKHQNKTGFKLTWTPSGVAFFLLAVWACCSCLWSPDIQVSLSSSLRLAFISLAGFVALQFVQNLRQTHSNLIQEGVLISLITSLGLIGLSLLNHQFFQGRFLEAVFNESALNHATSLLAMLIWTGAYIILEKKQYLLTAIFIGTCFFAIIYLDNHTATIATLLSLGVWGGSFFSPLRWTRILKVLILLLMALAPLLPKTIFAPEVVHLSFNEWQVKPTLTHRFYIWSLISHRIDEHPFRGGGINSTRIQYNQIANEQENQLNKLNFTNFIPQASFEKEIAGSALHPHNATLQMWVELGIPGIALAILIVWFIFREIENIKRPLSQRMALATFVTALTISHSSYGLWQTWWMASLWIITILVFSLINQTNQRNSP